MIIGAADLPRIGRDRRFELLARNALRPLPDKWREKKRQEQSDEKPEGEDEGGGDHGRDGNFRSATIT